MSTSRAERSLSRLTIAGQATFALAIGGSALALGSLDTPVLCCVVAGLCLSLALVWSGAEATLPRGVATLVFITALGLTLYTAFQTIPLPAGLIAAIAPHTADVWARSLSPLGEPGPRWHPISLDPIATKIEVLRGLAYLVAFLTAVRIARRRQGVAFLSWVLITSCALVAVAAIAHPAVGVDKVYGLITPKTGVSSIAPLLNINHLAGYVNIGAMVAFGALLSPRPIAPRAVIASLTLFLCATELWLASRGGVGSMLFGLILGTALYVLRKREGRDVRAAVVLTAAAVAAGVGMFVLAAFDSSLDQLADKDLSKLSVTRSCFGSMLPNYPLFGVGRGAFESTFPEFRTGAGAGFIVFSHPENILSQWFTEWGAIAATLGFGSLAYALSPRSALSRGDMALGPWFALSVLALHNLVDFSSEVPGVVLALVTCAAIVVGGSTDGRRNKWDLWASRPRLLVAISAGAAMIAIPVALSGRSHELLDERIRLRNASSDTNLSDAAFRAQIREAMLSHPAEAYFPYLGGAHALFTHHESVMPWMERTLDRAPVYGPAHLVLARWLRRRSPAQARLEYRLAAEQGAGLIPSTELVTLVGSFEDAQEIAPNGKAGVESLESISRALASSLPATRWRIDQDLLSRGPVLNVTVLAEQRLVQDALADLEAGDAAPWCADGSCPKIALEAADRAEARDPTSSTAFVVRARVMAMQGDPAGGLDHLRQACETSGDRPSCLNGLALLATDLHRDTEATRAIDDLSHAACKDDDACVSLLMLAASLEDRRGNTSRALVFLRHAAQITPERTDVLEPVASHAARLGLHADALDAYEKLARLNPNHPEYAALANRERAAVTLPAPP